MKEKVLRKCHLLNTNANDANERIIVNHDLTPKEGMKQNELRQELKQRRLA